MSIGVSIFQSARRGLRGVVENVKEQVEIERHRLERLICYDVTGDEIDQIERETLSISEDFSFATVGISVGLSFFITLLTVDITERRTFDIFFILCVLGFVASVYFGVRWWRGRGSFRTVIKRVKARVGPLGQEGKELVVSAAGATADSVGQENVR